jgi:isoleucyl-tRNA synthetase
MDYRSTLNLPSTAFPMRANLPKREPEILQRWETMNIYHLARQAREGKSGFYLHDGPPYANGAIHLGTGLNKILKDMINKSKLLLGQTIHYRPGWDCHGLPIELNVTQDIAEAEKETILSTELRRRCKEYALSFVDKHRTSFKRLGVIGEWERPYLTLNPTYEAVELRQFAILVKKGYVYQGLKPIHWCPSCQTALAEAEVEYEEHTSPSIYVRFPLTHASIQRISANVKALANKPVNVIIWTTTPWTLPANRAVCVHPNFIYTLLALENEYVLIAKDLINRFVAETGLKSTGTPMGSFAGKELEEIRITMKHPLDEREVPLISGAHVTLEQGTGAVHTAPGHGQEDYSVGLQYGLEIFSPVDNAGRLTKASPVFEGLRVEQSNQPIIQLLDEKQLLVNHEKYVHSYPHCWRCKKPIIFRATRQWFISLEKDNFRDRLLDAIDHVHWIPPWGRQRIRSMVENRLEWCISRQRAWGVPIPAVYFGKSEDGIVDERLIRELADIVEQESTDFWFRAIENPEEMKRLSRLQELLPAGMTLADVRLEKDILDVWFDSGVSHQSVMANEEKIYPVDMYLEGSDQHRGWFQSALVTATGAGYEPPYKTVLTHGFTVDENGRKLSKSLGNFVILDELVEKTGADVIRLWVSAEDFRGDMTFSQEILSRITESYRRIRNTIRFLLGNLYDYSPSEAVAEAERLSIDRWIMNRWRECKRRIITAYQKYDFHRIFYDLNNFCSVDLSAIYLDIIKDRLYVSKKQSAERKACQSALSEIVVELTACTAPILSFTCEEVWDYLLALKLVEEKSVFLYELDQNIPPVDPELLDWWDKIFLIRGEAIKAIELQRKASTIGHSLDCCVTLETDDPNWKSRLEKAVTNPRGDDLASVLIVSDCRLGAVDPDSMIFESPILPHVKIAVLKADGEKCPRCWHYHAEVGKNDNDVCPYCREALR